MGRIPSSKLRDAVCLFLSLSLSLSLSRGLLLCAASIIRLFLLPSLDIKPSRPLKRGTGSPRDDALGAREEAIVRVFARARREARVVHCHVRCAVAGERLVDGLDLGARRAVHDRRRTLLRTRQLRHDVRHVSRRACASRTLFLSRRKACVDPFQNKRKDTLRYILFTYTQDAGVPGSRPAPWGGR